MLMLDGDLIRLHLGIIPWFKLQMQTDAHHLFPPIGRCSLINIYKIQVRIKHKDEMSETEIYQQKNLLISKTSCIDT